MSSSSDEVMQRVNNVIGRGTFPDWVGSLLEKTFFDRCPIHVMQKIEMNRYCITCDESTCKSCISFGHYNHKILTIYRHVYQDVVPLSEMESHIDCAKIQPYKCNKKWVVSLTPLPHNGSGMLIEGDGACIVCKRKLTDPDRYRFCSVACKVAAITGRSVIHYPAFQRKEYDREIDNLGRRKHGRKGVPYKSPLF